MKTLKQIFIKKSNVKPQTSNTLSVREARDGVKEWLQQKRKHFEKGDLILTDLGVIDELLEELEQK